MLSFEAFSFLVIKHFPSVPSSKRCFSQPYKLFVSQIWICENTSNQIDWEANEIIFPFSYQKRSKQKNFSILVFYNATLISMRELLYAAVLPTLSLPRTKEIENGNES